MLAGRLVQMVLLAVLCSVCRALPVSAASSYQLTPYLSGEYFTWREFSGGARLLKESGTLYAGGLLAEFTPATASRSSLILRGRGELFGGVVDYDGETQAPATLPVQTRVSYLGVRQDLDLGYRYSGDRWYLEPFGGVGYRWWLRELHDATSSGQSVSGYTESWQSAYLRLGAQGRYRTASEVSLFAQGGAKYPFYTGNSVGFAGAGVTTFRPGGELSGFAELGASYRQLRLALSYEGFRFSRSSQIRVGTKDYFQPESRSDILGVNLGWSF